MYQIEEVRSLRVDLGEGFGLKKRVLASCFFFGDSGQELGRSTGFEPKNTRSGFGCEKENFSIFGSYFLAQNLYLDPKPDRNLKKNEQKK